MMETVVPRVRMGEERGCGGVSAGNAGGWWNCSVSLLCGGS